MESIGWAAPVILVLLLALCVSKRRKASRQERRVDDIIEDGLAQPDPLMSNTSFNEVPATAARAPEPALVMLADTHVDGGFVPFAANADFTRLGSLPLQPPDSVLNTPAPAPAPAPVARTSAPDPPSEYDYVTSIRGTRYAPTVQVATLDLDGYEYFTAEHNTDALLVFDDAPSFACSDLYEDPNNEITDSPYPQAVRVLQEPAVQYTKFVPSAPEPEPESVYEDLSNDPVAKRNARLSFSQASRSSVAAVPAPTPAVAPPPAAPPADGEMYVNMAAVKEPVQETYEAMSAPRQAPVAAEAPRPVNYEDVELPSSPQKPARDYVNLIVPAAHDSVSAAAPAAHDYVNTAARPVVEAAPGAMYANTDDDATVPAVPRDSVNTAAPAAHDYVNTVRRDSDRISATTGGDVPSAAPPASQPEAAPYYVNASAEQRAVPDYVNTRATSANPAYVDKTAPPAVTAGAADGPYSTAADAVPAPSAHTAPAEPEPEPEHEPEHEMEGRWDPVYGNLVDAPKVAKAAPAMKHDYVNLVTGAAKSSTLPHRRVSEPAVAVERPHTPPALMAAVTEDDADPPREAPAAHHKGFSRSLSVSAAPAPSPAPSHPLVVTVPSEFYANVDHGGTDTSKVWLVAPLDTARYKKLDQNRVPQSSIPACVRNKQYNRHLDVLPNPTTRVPLTAVEGDETSVYINANFIRDGNGNGRAFICTQAPQEMTIIHFWRMVWEHGVTGIIMATGLMEKGEEKCQQYWPDEPGLTIPFMDISITMTEAVECDGFLRTVLELSCEDEVRELTHWWFRAWPDHGVPKRNGQPDPSQCIGMLQDVRETGPTGPLLMHCSAGVGRSGTLVAMHICMGLLDQHGRVDPAYVTFMIRQDRVALVQHVAQFELLHAACLHYGRLMGREVREDVHATMF